MKTRYLLSAAAAAMLAAGSAHATVQVTTGLLLSNGGSLSAGEVMLLNFENPDPEKSLISGLDIVTGGQYGFYTGSHTGVAAAPLNNGTQYLAVLGRNQANTGPGEVTINFGLLASGFSLDVGSIDDYNSFEVQFLNAATQTWTGSDMTQTFQSWTDAASNRRVKFTGNAGERFTAVKLISSQNSLEVDNLAITAAVPEPATWALMIVGFGLVGAAARRRSVGPRTVNA